MLSCLCFVLERSIWILCLNLSVDFVIKHVGHGVKYLFTKTDQPHYIYIYIYLEFCKEKKLIISIHKHFPIWNLSNSSEPPAGGAIGPVIVCIAVLQIQLQLCKYIMGWLHYLTLLSFHFLLVWQTFGSKMAYNWDYWGHGLCWRSRSGILAVATLNILICIHRALSTELRSRLIIRNEHFNIIHNNTGVTWVWPAAHHFDLFGKEKYIHSIHLSFSASWMNFFVVVICNVALTYTP